ncbi:chromosome segregation protein SMC [Aliidiomarina maris]|uniref:Chromosome partition protein Smc n=1 Tax=Aliidiomarina maris TaxID=531312 RepID=A0A327X4Z0_9GAMM|nr:chromosome segregation protein SMC [Aliidiomarina maris]RAK01719.1 condensin subunit Smc [Aliidiomarina maris]RUO28538.1 chromosome segregation protein SMC [Aliidiomarina maris]
MRLNYIKLAGFKSFVDATKVPFPDQMTCVVGPNGCGKSNVIDAVRWVLGESSAKNLRGDAMTDVIFNGSSARKPVSRASVELVFDNSEGRLQGEFASYNDISVKRVVTRDGQSNYFLNGSKCRRRDITDLFLGTGLGPRSYAIIEQGMISKLIESRPQELRVFIEEAAGISKYKERRKETENRMRKTHENLERLTDVRDELGTQLSKLQRQAAAAQRYKALKAEERELKAQLQGLRWNHYQQQCDLNEQQLAEQQTELERWVAQQRGSEHGQHQLREQQQDLKDQLDDATQQFYQCNNEITRIEQGLQHQRQLAEQRRKDLQDATWQLSQLDQEYQAEHDEQATFEADLVRLEPMIALHQAKQEEAAARLDTHDDAIEQAQAKLQQAQQQVEHQRQQVQVISTQLEGQQALTQRLLQQQRDTEQRIETIKHQTIEAQLAQANAELLQQQQQLSAAEAAHSQAEHDLNQAQMELENQRQAQQSVEQDWLNVNSQLDSYQTLLDNADTPPSEALQTWLEQYEWRPLRELLQVDDVYSLAVEAVAEPWLNAPVLLGQDVDTIVTAPGQHGQLLALDTEQPAPPSASLAHHLLARSVSGGKDSIKQGLGAYFSLFRQVAWIPDGAEALATLRQSGLAMGVDEKGRIYTKDAWRQTPQDGHQVLAWQRMWDALNARKQTLEPQRSLVTQQVHKAQDALQQAKQQAQQTQQRWRDAHQQSVQLTAQCDTLRRQHSDQQHRLDELQLELEQVSLQLAEHTEKSHMLALEREEYADQLAQHNPQLQQLQQRVNDLKQELQPLRDQFQQLQQQGHQLNLQVQQSKQGAQHSERNLARLQQSKVQLQQRIDLLSASESDVDTELEQAQLEEALLRREEAETRRRDLGEQLAQVDAEIRTLNQGQQGVQQRIEAQREKVEASKLALTAARERGHSLLEGLQETGYSLKQVLESMPADADEAAWQQRLDKISRSLQQLGAINLAAIEEAQAQAERKAYLDAQHDDLTQSLALLEDAIKKIDKETRQRFRKTFDQVNSDLGQLFPKVFGGGSAYLALTDDDLLETGVTIMARPPGKKNSTIHLLSGGEKALTALSLVFAIFRLNPAPFCMLDEVDAPLDDANVGRFCRLVEEMSETVQFIYISHNKIAMEMATHLAGVTMQEPGVSRLVAVDVDAAVAMAEA